MADGEFQPPWLDGISGEYLPRLIESRARVIRVVAGPGSGKTTGLKRRIQRLVQGDGMDPTKIFVGTFTRAIAKDLRDELGTDIYVSTLHSHALQLLRSNPAALGGLKLRFLLKYEEAAMLYDIAPETPDLADQRARTDVLNRQQAARSDMADLPDAAFAGAVDRWLRRHGGMLVGDVVHLAVQGLSSRDIPPGQFDEVVVDEYQDLTAAEQELVEHIWSGEGSLVVLGDNDQSIYSFRYNHPLGIDQFRDRWRGEGLDDLDIPENRRCGETILILANVMMAEAGSAKPPIVSMSGREGDLTALTWETVVHEIQGLATYLRSQSDRSFLVLVPRRFLGHRLAAAIGDDARTAFHQRVLEQPVVQDRFAALSLIADPNDGVAVRAWLGFAGLRPAQADRRNAAAYSSLEGYEVNREMLLAVANGDVNLKGSGQADLERRARMGVDLLKQAEAVDPNEIIDRLFDPQAAEVVEDPDKRTQAETDLQLLRDAAKQLLEREEDLPGVASALRYRIATRAPLVDEEEEPRIRIMTLHSAKGLQADNIVLAGMADQMVPGLTQDPELREEQRRLLYVAITRAKHELLISWSREMRFDEAMKNYVRPDKVRTIEGEKVLQLSRSSLLPRSMQRVDPGEEWSARYE